MPSKKKSTRNGAKKAKEKQETPDTQMERLKIDKNSQADEDALLEEAIKLAAAEKEALEAAAAEQEETCKCLVEKNNDGCDHGYVATEERSIIKDFAKTFMSEFCSEGAGVTWGHRFAAANKATTEKYPEVWEDPSNLKLVASHFIAYGTRQVLQGKINDARLFASVACHVEECMSICSGKKNTFNETKTLELMGADEHTLVKYSRKSIPCKCLDGKYEEVKSITKMGLCMNRQCHVPGRMVERRTMLYCTRCRRANYCSPECQRAAWPEHKEVCDEIVEKKAEFNSKQKEKERQAKNTH